MIYTMVLVDRSMPGFQEISKESQHNTIPSQSPNLSRSQEHTEMLIRLISAIYRYAETAIVPYSPMKHPDGDCTIPVADRV